MGSCCWMPAMTRHHALPPTACRPAPCVPTLSQLLGYPRKPAVMLLNVFSWYAAAEPPGTHGHPNATFGHYWKTNERDFFELSQYYGLPTLSARGGMYHTLREGRSRGGGPVTATTTPCLGVVTNAWVLAAARLTATAADVFKR